MGEVSRSMEVAGSFEVVGVQARFGAAHVVNDAKLLSQRILRKAHRRAAA